MNGVQVGIAFSKIGCIILTHQESMLRGGKAFVRYTSTYFCHDLTGTCYHVICL